MSYLATCLRQSKHLATPLALAALLLLPLAAQANTCDVEDREDGCSDPTNSGLYDNTFRKSCKLHDRCYATDGMSKNKCDNFFEKSMKSACEDLPFYEEPTCKLSADIFYDAVQIGGGSSYNGGQNWSQNNCSSTTDWWSKIYRGNGNQVTCPSGLVMAGRYHLSEDDGFDQYFCTAVASPQIPLSWTTVQKGTYFQCPPQHALVGMENKSNGKFGARCAFLPGVILSLPSWTGQIDNNNGTTYYCPNDKILVGFKKSNAGPFKYACASYN